MIWFTYINMCEWLQLRNLAKALPNLKETSAVGDHDLTNFSLILSVVLHIKYLIPLKGDGILEVC